MTGSSRKGVQDCQGEIPDTDSGSGSPFPLAEKTVASNLTVEQINRLLFWFESEPSYADFCSALRAEIARREGMN